MKNESRLAIGDSMFDPALAGLFDDAAVLREGAGGGGRIGGNDGGLRMAASAFAFAPPSCSLSCSSLALGTMSERNSRSSDDSASEFRGLPEPMALRRLEKRFKKRDTADGAG